MSATASLHLSTWTERTLPEYIRRSGMIFAIPAAKSAPHLHLRLGVRDRIASKNRGYASENGGKIRVPIAVRDRIASKIGAILGKTAAPNPCPSHARFDEKNLQKRDSDHRGHTTAEFRALTLVTNGARPNLARRVRRRHEIGCVETWTT